MGLATIDPHSHKVQTKLYKIPKFDVNRLKVSKIQPIETVKIYKDDMAIRTLSDTASGWPYISLLLLTFLNRCVSVKTSLMNTKLRNLVNLVFLTM